MVSSKDKKETNKKKAQSPQVSSRGEPPTTTSNAPSTDGPSKVALSPRNKLQKKPSQNSVDISERAPTVVDVTLGEEEEASNQAPLNATSPVPSDVVVRFANPSEVLKPPPTHYIPVEVKLYGEYSNPTNFNTNVRFNRNMVITGVKHRWAFILMPGDQVTSIGGTPVWNVSHLRREFRRLRSEDRASIILTVIRVWNYSCPNETHLAKAGLTVLDDRYQYFVTRLWHYYRTQGMILTNVKKVCYIAELRAKSDACYGLLPGDQLLLFGDQVMTAKSAKSFKKRQSDYRDYMRMQNAAKVKFIDVFACRPILARSTPNPSIEAELCDLFPDRLKPPEKEKNAMAPPPTAPANPTPPPPPSNNNNNPPAVPPPSVLLPEKKESEELGNPLLEADALEIALRELCLLQQLVKPDEPLPYIERGRTLLRPAPPPAATTTATTNNAEKSVYAAPSVYGQSPSTMGTPTAGTPRKLKKWKKEKPARQRTISFKSENETSKITSDIPEEAELKKCDPRSGIVAYIKNAFNN